MRVQIIFDSGEFAILGFLQVLAIGLFGVGLTGKPVHNSPRQQDACYLQ
jgi:hypothetical protein